MHLTIFMYIYNQDGHPEIKKVLSIVTNGEQILVSMYLNRRTPEMTHLHLAKHFSENLQNYGILLVA